MSEVVGFEPKRRFQVAIIEDDQSIQHLISESIKASVYDSDFIQFRNAQDAIYELWERSPTTRHQIDLLFLDIQLNDNTNGLDILDYIQYLPTDIPVILISSYFNKEYIDRINQTRRRTPIMLKKPFGPTEILSLTKWGLNSKM